jgi:hypothetical protein
LTNFASDVSVRFDTKRLSQLVRWWHPGRYAREEFRQRRERRLNLVAETSLCRFPIQDLLSRERRDPHDQWQLMLGMERSAGFQTIVRRLASFANASM